MTRKIQLASDSDRADFESWAQAMPQTAIFNWTYHNLMESFKKDNCWGFWDRNELQAVVCFLQASEPVEIIWLATRPESSGQGYMRLLLSDLINNTAQQEFCKGSQILLEVHEMNLNAIKLYYSLGFIELGRRKNYYKDGAQALLMIKKVE